MISDFWAHYQPPFFLIMVIYPNLKASKFRVLKLGFPSQTGRPKLKLFWLLMLDKWNFQCRQIWKKDNIWQKLGVTKMEVSLKRGRQIFELLSR